MSKLSTTVHHSCGKFASMADMRYAYIVTIPSMHDQLSLLQGRYQGHLPVKVFTWVHLQILDLLPNDLHDTVNSFLQAYPAGALAMSILAVCCLVHHCHLSNCDCRSRLHLHFMRGRQVQNRPLLLQVVNSQRSTMDFCCATI